MSVHHPLFAQVYGRFGDVVEAGRIGRARREILEQARGVVLDLGAGTGANLAHLPGAVTAVHAVEPDPSMIRWLRPRLPAHATLHQARGEDLPLPDAGVDTVLATLTLCSVQDVPAVLAEIRRVLAPGGQVLVLEHVLAERTAAALAQRAFRLPWRLAGGGCSPVRDTPKALAGAGFDVSGLRRFEVRGALLASEWVTGVVV